MEHQELQAVTEAVLSRLFVEMEASGRHVHVTKEHARRLFGHDLTEKRPLSQPGQYLANERVTLVGPKGDLANVAVLGPARPESQVEISLTDGRQLGITPPVRLSGHVKDTPGVVLKGPRGHINLDHGVIAAQRHIHLNPEDAKHFAVQDGQRVRLQAFTQRPVIFEDVTVRIHPEFASRAHLDYDEANACGFRDGDLGRILP